MHVGIAVGAEFCHAESPPMTDPILWTFATMAAKFDDINIQRGVPSSPGAGSQKDCITITTVCTLLIFIFGIITGLIAHHCISALIKRKGERQSEASSQQIVMSGTTIHWERGGNKETSGIYEEVNCESKRSNIQLELKKNIAYGDVQY